LSLDEREQNARLREMMDLEARRKVELEEKVQAVRNRRELSRLEKLMRRSNDPENRP
jgi:hypothetical protein